MKVSLDIEMFHMPNFLRLKGPIGDSNGVDVGVLFPSNGDAERFWEDAKLHWLAHVERRRLSLGKRDE